MKKLSIGTAQFGFDYGISNKYGQVRKSEISKILMHARNYGIKNIDTARSYGKSEKILGKFDMDNFKITTKFLIPEKCKNVEKWIIKEIKKSLKSLQIENLHGLLLHNSKILESAQGLDTVYSLNKLKDLGIVKKIGISIYDPIELDLYQNKFKFDIVQAPLNLIDRRIITSGWLGKLQEQGVEIQIRSIFLQGLLLMPSKKIPLRFTKWINLFEKYDLYLKNKNISSLKVALLFSLSIREVSNIVIGIENENQFLEIIDAANTPSEEIEFPDIQCNDPMLINPSNWLKI